MKKANQNTKSAIKKIADRIVIKESREWPPGCYGFIYQPMRPSVKREETRTTEK